MNLYTRAKNQVDTVLFKELRKLKSEQIYFNEYNNSWIGLYNEPIINSEVFDTLCEAGFLSDEKFGFDDFFIITEEGLIFLNDFVDKTQRNADFIR